MLLENKKNILQGWYINLAAERDFKLDINELVNVPTGLSNLKAKEANGNVDKLKTVLVNLRKDEWFSE